MVFANLRREERIGLGGDEADGARQLVSVVHLDEAHVAPAPGAGVGDVRRLGVASGGTARMGSQNNSSPSSNPSSG